MSTKLLVQTAEYSADGTFPSQRPALRLDGNNTFMNAPANPVFSVPLFVHIFDRYRLMFNWQTLGTPVGTLEVQFSNDQNGTADHSADKLITNWFDETFFVNGVATTVFNVTGSGPITLDQNFCNSAWIRLKYTPTSGFITPTAEFMFKGDGGR